MSKGSDKITVRVGATMRDEIEKWCERRNALPGGIEPWTFTDFIIQAVVDKLNHGERSRRTKRKCRVVTRHLPTAIVKGIEWTEEDVKPVREPSPMAMPEKTLDNEQRSE